MNHSLRWTSATLLLLGTMSCANHQQFGANFRDRWHDQGVRSAVRLQLMRDDRVQAKHVRVAVRDGQVTLQGHVRSAAERVRAEDNARRAEGVASVVNRIEVMDRSTVPVVASPMVASRGDVPTTTIVREERRVQDDFTPSLVTPVPGKAAKPVAPIKAAAPAKPIAAPKAAAAVKTATPAKPAAPAKVAAPAVAKPTSTVTPITKKPPVIAAPTSAAAADGGYIDRGMLPPSSTTIGGKPSAALAAPAWVKREAAAVEPAAVAPSAKPTSPAHVAPVTPRIAPASDDSLAQEAADELRRLKQGQ